jgi:hypothetical protein
MHILGVLLAIAVGPEQPAPLLPALGPAVATCRGPGPTRPPTGSRPSAAQSAAPDTLRSATAPSVASLHPWST